MTHSLAPQTGDGRLSCGIALNQPVDSNGDRRASQVDAIDTGSEKEKKLTG